MSLTLEQYSEAKKLPLEFLRDVGLRRFKDSGDPCVLIRYFSDTGDDFARRLRLSLDSPQFRWLSGNRRIPFMLGKLKEIQQAGWVVLLEGIEQETNALTMWVHGVPALGVPDGWQSEWKPYLAGIDVFIWQGDEDFSNRVGNDIPDAKIIIAPPEISNVNDAHLKGVDVRGLIERLKVKAIPIERLRRQAAEGRIGELREQARSVLDSDDPLKLVRAALTDLGYGGDLRRPELVYLGISTRLLKLRHGQMPAHILILGPPSVGKSYLIGIVKQLFPNGLVYEIPAGSPAVILYTDFDFRHRVALFYESDSLPAGEDNPIASAIRNLAQDHRLRYSYTAFVKALGRRVVKEIDKEGPTVLLTTSTRRLGHQLDTRLFTVDVSGDAAQVKAALTMLADLELRGPRIPNPALVAFQEYLQEKGALGCGRTVCKSYDGPN